MLTQEMLLRCFPTRRELSVRSCRPVRRAARSTWDTAVGLKRLGREILENFLYADPCAPLFNRKCECCRFRERPVPMLFWKALFLRMKNCCTYVCGIGGASGTPLGQILTVGPEWGQ